MRTLTTLCSWLCALEAGGHGAAAVVDKEGEVDGDVEADAEDVGVDGEADADGGLQVGQAGDEGAAGLLGRLPHLRVDEPVQHVRAHAQLHRVHRALARRLRARVTAARRRRRNNNDPQQQAGDHGLMLLLIAAIAVICVNYSELRVWFSDDRELR